MQIEKYYESRYAMEQLNHSECVDHDNIGWTSGVLVNGIPFEAELWVMDNELSMSVMIPEVLSEQLESSEQIEFNMEDNTVISCCARIENGVLKVGLDDVGIVYDDEVIIRYVEFLEEFGLVTFCGEEYNGGGHRYRDKSGNHIIEVIVTLNSNGKTFAETPLAFRGFGENKHSFFMYKKMHI